MSLYASHTCMHDSTGRRSRGNVITGSCELAQEPWELNPGPLQARKCSLLF